MTEHPASLSDRLTQDMKTALRGGERFRLGVIRLMRSSIKQREIDDRQALDDAGVLGVLDKMVKQRRDSVEQFVAADREDLAALERSEIEIIVEYLPAALGEDEIVEQVAAAIAEVGASSMRDMGQVMGLLQPRLQGRADMGAVSALVKERLTS